MERGVFHLLTFLMWTAPHMDLETFEATVNRNQELMSYFSKLRRIPKFIYKVSRDCPVLSTSAALHFNELQAKGCNELLPVFAHRLSESW